MVADDDLVMEWWTYQRLLVGSRAERKALESGEPPASSAAADAVHERTALGGLQALSLVVALIRGARTPDDLALVGAGPLEDLVIDHAHDLAEHIDEAARREPAFAEALLSVDWSPPDRDPAQRLRRWLSIG